MEFMPYQLYIASCVPSGGVYLYDVLENGEILGRALKAVNSPTYLDLCGDHMNIIGRPAPGSGDTDSRICSCEIQEDGKLGERSPFTSTLGGSGCYVMEYNGTVYAANYITGSLFMKKKNGDCRLYKLSGHGHDPDRQASAHSHQIITTPDRILQPDGSWKQCVPMLCATDLGLDAVILLDTELNEIDRTFTPPGCGPRHTVFSPCGNYAYTVNELNSTVTVFSFDGRYLTALDTVSSLPADFVGISYGAAIRITGDGKHLYCTNRGHDSIAHFSVDGGSIKLLDLTDTGGSWPRDFALSPDEKFVVCTNERGCRVTLYARQEDGSLTRLPQTIEMPSPLCAVYRPLS